MIVKKDEMAALRAAHEIEYESEDEYLKAMFLSVVQLLEQRDSWAVRIQWAEGSTPYGPWYNKASAAKAGGRMASILEGQVSLHQLHAPSKLNEPTEESK